MKFVQRSRQHWVENFFKMLMLLSLVLVAGSLGWIVITLLVKGLPYLNWQMLTQTPQGGFYLGNGGGILNAILGSLYLGIGGTLLALLLSLPILSFLSMYIRRRARFARLISFCMDILWGIPSIVYGAFAFTIMAFLGLRTSLLGGIITLAILELPIMTRGMDVVVRNSPVDIQNASLALGATRLETLFQVVFKQMLPGMVAAVLLAFGRGIGDAASVLFTAGYTDHIPTSLMDPVASLPLAVFFQLSTPYPEVQQRAYASALVLTLIVLFISLFSRWIARRLGRYTIR
jgi:phosphate transport system permease protein